MTNKILQITEKPIVEVTYNKDSKITKTTQFLGGVSMILRDKHGKIKKILKEGKWVKS